VCCLSPIVAQAAFLVPALFYDQYYADYYERFHDEAGNHVSQVTPFPQQGVALPFALSGAIDSPLGLGSQATYDVAVETVSNRLYVNNLVTAFSASLVGDLVQPTPSTDAIYQELVVAVNGQYEAYNYDFPTAYDVLYEQISGVYAFHLNGFVAPGQSMDVYLSGSNDFISLDPNPQIFHFDEGPFSINLADEAGPFMSYTYPSRRIVNGRFAMQVNIRRDVNQFPNANTGNSWITGSITFNHSAFSPSPPGDFDNDGDVDGRDFLAWQRNPSLGNLADWQANYGNGSLQAINTAVPEPGAWVLLTGGLLVAGRRRIHDGR
jgi:hypothetical protein